MNALRVNTEFTTNIATKSHILYTRTGANVHAHVDEASLQTGETEASSQTPMDHCQQLVEIVSNWQPTNGRIHNLNKFGELVTLSIRLEGPGDAIPATCMPWKHEIADGRSMSKTLEAERISRKARTCRLSTTSDQQCLQLRQIQAAEKHMRYRHHSQ